MLHLVCCVCFRVFVVIRVLYVRYDSYGLDAIVMVSVFICLLRGGIANGTYGIHKKLYI